MTGRQVVDQDEQVERMAQAMHAVDDCVGSPPLAWDDEDTPRSAYRTMARAALRASVGAS